MEVEKSFIVDHITKEYKLFHGAKKRFLGLMASKTMGALTDVSFVVEKGDLIGFVALMVPVSQHYETSLRELCQKLQVLFK